MGAEELYQLLDDPQQVYHAYKVAEQFTALGENYRLEAIAFSFDLDDRAILSQVKNSAVELIETDTAKIFFQQRLAQTTNNKTLARYGHLLWQFHRFFPGYKAAVAAYIALADFALTGMFKEEKIFSRWHKAICAALILSAATNDKITFERAADLVNRLLLSLLPVWMKSVIVAYILNHLRNKSEAFDLDAYVQQLTDMETPAGYSRMKDDFETAINADTLFGGKRQALLMEKLADSIRAHAMSRTNDPARIATMPQMAEAMAYYKKAKADIKYQEAAQEYELLRKTRKVNEVSLNVLDGDMAKQVYDYIENKKKYYLSIPVHDLLLTLATDTYLLPELANDQEKGIFGQFAGQFTLVDFDINKNPKKLSGAGGQRLDTAFIYNLKYQLFTQQYISGIMHELIGKEQLSIEILDAFFDKTWITKTILNTGKSDECSNLYSLIRPALNYYLEQAGKRIRDEEADFVLCIDSLVLKYEMLIRCFLQHQGVPTTTIDGASGDPRENYLPELLEKLPEDSFDEKDKQLMRHIYTKAGIDLRNNIAHSYLAPKSYTLELADTVVWSIIRLGQYVAQDETTME